MLLLAGHACSTPAVTFAERVRKEVEAHTFTFEGGTLQAHGQLRRRRMAAPADLALRRSCVQPPTTRCTSPRNGTQSRRPVRQRRVQRARAGTSMISTRSGAVRREEESPSGHG